MRSTLELAAPHNWCDRRCERCPLSTSCPIPGLAERAFDAILGDAVERLEAICRERGSAPTTALPSPPPKSLDAHVHGEAGDSWAAAFAALEPTVTDAVSRSLFVTGKVARIAFVGDLGDDELWSREVVPNLVVLERVLETAGAEVERVRSRLPAQARVRFDEADALLRGLLSPLIGASSPQDRAVFAALAAAGRAPSPLATR
jgi:hypothetical protein